MEFVSTNPATGKQLTRWPLASPLDRDRLLDQARATFAERREHTPAQRGQLLRAVAAELRRQREPLAQLATQEMGKPISESLAEVDKCAAGCEYFAEHGPGMLADQPHPSNASESYVSYLPLGVIFAIMPWNFPYWQVFRHAAPAVMAGNGVLVKHAENTQGVAHALVEVFSAAGAPPGLVSTVVADTDTAGELIKDDRIAAVTLTGSTRAGAAVGALAGGAWKKSVLELGGSDCFVVLDDADVPQAAQVAVRSRFQNTGQSCIAAKRFIVDASVAGEFTDAFLAAVDQLRLGDPTEPDTTLGPLARPDLRDELDRQLRDSVAGGAKVLRAGGPLDGPGNYFAPAVLAIEDTALPCWTQETFGPLAPILVVDGERAALAAAADSAFGLGGNVWTRDLQRGKAFARQVPTGAMFVNGMTASHPGLPFGGVKRSGYGRELATVGAREFTNVQTVWVG